MQELKATSEDGGKTIVVVVHNQESWVVDSPYLDDNDGDPMVVIEISRP